MTETMIQMESNLHALLDARDSVGWLGGKHHRQSPRGPDVEVVPSDGLARGRQKGSRGIRSLGRLRGMRGEQKGFRGQWRLDIISTEAEVFA
jgi:hypothetical protein